MRATPRDRFWLWRKAWIDASQPEVTNENETQIDEATRAKLRALGYVD